MTPKAIARKLRDLWDGLSLREWELRVQALDVEALANGVLGRVEPDRDTMTATVSVAAARPDGDVEWTCVHEMIHLALNDLAAAFDAAVEQLGSETRSVALATWRDAEERTAIRLARWATGRSATDGS